MVECYFNKYTHARYLFKAQMQLDGSVKIGSFPSESYKNNNFGYMYQQNLFCGVLTVKEHLTFMVNYLVTV